MMTKDSPGVDDTEGGRLAASLIARGNAMASSGRFGDASLCYDDVIERLSGSDDIEVRRQVRIALGSKGVLLVKLGRLEEADGVFSELLSRAHGAQDPEYAFAQAQRLIALAYSKTGHYKRALRATEALSKRVLAESAERLDLIFYACTVRTDVLVSMDRVDEAIQMYDGFIDQHGQVREPTAYRYIAKARNGRASLLDYSGDYKKALCGYDELILRLSDTLDPALRKSLAAALRGKVRTLHMLGRYRESIAVDDEVLLRFGDDPSFVASVLDALMRKAWTLGRLDQKLAAIAIYDQVVRDYGEESSSYMRGKVAESLVNKAGLLLDCNRNDEVVTVIDNLTGRLRELNVTNLSVHIARGFNFKALGLGRLGRLEEAVMVDKEAIEHFSGLTEPELVEVIANVLGHEAYCLKRLGQLDRSVAVWDGIIERYADSSSPGLRRVVRRAVREKIAVQAFMGRLSEAAASAAMLIDFDMEENNSERSAYRAEMSITQGIVMLARGDFDEAINIFDEIIDLESALPEQVAYALYGKATALEYLGRSEESSEVFQDMLSRFSEEALDLFDSGVDFMADAPNLGEANLLQRKGAASLLYGKALAFSRLERDNEALSTLTDLISRFEGDGDPTIQETVAGAREMRENILSEKNGDDIEFDW